MKALLFSLFLITFSGLQAATQGLSDVLKARDLLGKDTWSRVVYVDRREGNSVGFYGLAFEFNRVLWFYNPEEGTQNLSRFVGRTERDKPRVLELVQKLYPTVRRARMENDFKGTAPSKDVPHNGCFVTSVAAWREEERRGGRHCEAGLFSYYWRSHSGLRGHTVLLMDGAQGREVFDTSRPGRPVIRIPDSVSTSSKTIAESIDPDVEVLSTRFVPIYDVAEARCSSRGRG